MIIFPQHTLKINLPRGAASKRDTAHRRGGDKKRGNLLKSYNGLFDKMIERPETVAAINAAENGTAYFEGKTFKPLAGWGAQFLPQAGARHLEPPPP